MEVRSRGGVAQGDPPLGGGAERDRALVPLPGLAFKSRSLDSSALSLAKETSGSCSSTAQFLSPEVSLGLPAPRDASFSALPPSSAETSCGFLEGGEGGDAAVAEKWSKTPCVSAEKAAECKCEGRPLCEAEEKPVLRRTPTLRVEDLPSGVLNCQYAVRGPTVSLANELAEALARGERLSFSSLIRVNIGDPQALGQPPIAYYRQVLACLVYPPLVNLPLCSQPPQVPDAAASEQSEKETQSSVGSSSAESRVSTHPTWGCDEEVSLGGEEGSAPSPRLSLSKQKQALPPEQPASDDSTFASERETAALKEEREGQTLQGLQTALKNGLVLSSSPFSLNSQPEPENKTGFPSDVVDTARSFLAALKTVGAYTHSQGAPLLREKVAAFFSRRDQYEASPDEVFLTDGAGVLAVRVGAGASAAVSLLMELLIKDSTDGVLLPVPQYPLYQGLLTRAGGVGVGYFLDEENDWAVDAKALREAAAAARASGTHLKALVVINPGNPTGQVLTREKLEEVVRFCEQERLVLVADEVYQENVYGETPFVSLRKVAFDLRASVSVASLHSSSKGFVGECGLRGGCMLLSNVDEDVRRQLYKIASMSLCSNTLGQAAIALVCSPPSPSGPSFARFVEQKAKLLRDSRAKAKLAYERLNAIPGVSCRAVNGAVFCFPKIELPKRAEEEAAAVGRRPDAHFCLELLRATGIVAVDGSGFGQKPGEWHVRICILPPFQVLEAMLDKFAAFYKKFCAKYAADE